MLVLLLISFITKARALLSASAVRYLRFNHKLLTETSTRKQRSLEAHTLLAREESGYERRESPELGTHTPRITEVDQNSPHYYGPVYECSLGESSTQSIGLNNEIKFLGKGLHLSMSVLERCSGHVFLRGHVLGVSVNMHRHACSDSSVRWHVYEWRSGWL